MSKMPRQMAVIEEQLLELRSNVVEVREAGLLDFATEIYLDSLLFQERLLTDELKAAHLLQGQTAIQVTVNGAPVKEHAIDASFLGPFLMHLQDLVNATAQAIQGIPTQRGAVHSHVQDENKLYLSALMPTSFGLNFQMPDEQKATLFPEVVNVSAVEAMTDLLNGDNGTEGISYLVSHPRIKKHYERLVHLVSERKADLQVRTQSLPLGVHLSSTQAGEISAWLDNFVSEERSVRVVGFLTAANLRLESFEIVDFEGKIYSGKMAKHVVNWAIRYINSKVIAEMRMTILAHKETSIESNPSYFLRELTKPEDEGSFRSLTTQ